jgi:beta-glucosidase
MGHECRALGVGVLLGPGVNIARVPVCGRNFEYFGEDPYLAGEMAASYIRGVRTYPVITTVKHFACNNSEYDRHKSNSEVDERSLRELYLPAFKKALEAGSLGIMTSYNQVNGIYSSEHPYLIGSILRGEWGFDGLVVSDWNSLYSTDGTLKNGVDLEMPKGRYFTVNWFWMPWQGGPPPKRISMRKFCIMLTSYEKAGLFSRSDGRSGMPSRYPGEPGCCAERRTGCPVLLKNEEQALPLSPSSRICIGGTNAYTVAQGGGSSMVQLETAPLTFAELMQKEGSFLLPGRWFKHSHLKQRVRSSNAVVLVVGFDHIEESEAYDRPWALNAVDLKAIKTAVRLNKRTIVVVQSGSAVEMESWQDGVAAILYTSFLGSSTAQALKALLFGQVSPSGKLPFTQARYLHEYRAMRSYPKNFDTVTIDRIKKGRAILRFGRCRSSAIRKP